MICFLLFLIPNLILDAVQLRIKLENQQCESEN